jgi:hypothetical protein
VATTKTRKPSHQGAEDNDDGEEIVASCRVFRRRVYVSGREVDVGGIGEVCTSSDHHRRGLSRELLSDCLAALADDGTALSFLHAAPDFFPVYEGAGYVGAKTSWTVVPYRHSSTASNGEEERPGLRVRPASFPADAGPLSRLYRELCSSRSGCLVRSAEYWERYLAEEWKGRFWVAVTAATATGAGEEQEDGEAVRGWMIARWRGSSGDGTRRVQVCDFGHGGGGSGDPGAARQAFDALLRRVVDELCLSGDGASSSASQRRRIDVVLPTIAASAICRPSPPGPGGMEDGGIVDWASATVECDHGWMYRALGDGSQELLDEITASDHLMWPADSF